MCSTILHLRIRVALQKKSIMNQPPKWKFAVMVWIAIYPTITLLQLLVGKHIKHLPLPLITLIMTLILVPTMVFVLLPLLRKVLGKWLMK